MEHCRVVAAMRPPPPSLMQPAEKENGELCLHQNCLPPPPLVQTTANGQRVMEPTPGVGKGIAGAPHCAWSMHNGCAGSSKLRNVACKKMGKMQPELMRNDDWGHAS